MIEAVVVAAVVAFSVERQTQAWRASCFYDVSHITEPPVHMFILHSKGSPDWFQWRETIGKWTFANDQVGSGWINLSINKGLCTIKRKKQLGLPEQARCDSGQGKLLCGKKPGADP